MKRRDGWLAGSSVVLACALAVAAAGGYRYWHKVSELRSQLDLIDACDTAPDPNAIERLCNVVSVGTTSETGVTPLMVAASLKKRELVASLLRRGADVNAADREGRTALMMAGMSTEISTLLIGYGADVHATSPRWGSALHNSGSAALVELLVDRGADLNATDGDGMTALMSLAKSEQVELVQTLLKRGANVNAVNALGETTLTIAEDRRRSLQRRRPRLNAVIALLRRHGASTKPSSADPAAESDRLRVDVRVADRIGRPAGTGRGADMAK